MTALSGATGAALWRTHHCLGSRTTSPCSLEDVARRLGRTSGAVRMLWVRALARLREELREELRESSP
ncbi:MAG: sigma factor-like helix-turn-helix DNA-binding protein [Limisphaerales bacterium]